MNLTDWEAVSWAFAAIALDIVVRSLMLAALCGLTVWLLRFRTAALRFSLWLWMLFGLLALPALIRITPPLLKSTHTVSQVETVVLPRPLASAVTTLNRQPHTQSFSTEPARPSAPWVLAISTIYLLVTLTLLIRFVYNLHRLRRIAARSQFIPDAQFRELSHEIWLASGAFLKPRLASSDEISVPVTFDAEDIWILLPESWRDWDEAKLRAVLTHEMAHIERRDSPNLQLASFATCLFWFHPLSWFLRRQLSVLAEEACDEVVVTSVATPEHYANLLIDFATDVGRWHGRLIAEATGVVRCSGLQHRIEKLFALKQGAQRGRKVLTILAMALFAPALYLTAAGRFEEPQSQPKVIWPQWTQIVGLSDADAAALEATLQANPDDLDTRMELLVYFAHEGNDQLFTAQLLWFIEHHPDIATLQMAQGMFRYNVQLSEGSAEKIRTAWEQAVGKLPGSSVVLVNAASFLEQTDPERGLQLLREAQILDATVPDQHEREIATIYAAAEVEALQPEARFNNIRMSHEAAVRLRAQLKNSADPALLVMTGRILVEMNDPRHLSEEQNSRGLALIRQAITLDPANSKWTEALDAAQAEPQRRVAFERLNSEPPRRGLVRIGSAVAEASLIAKVDPIYPPLALTARIQGSVEFTVTVGADGKVENLELVRGHPLLVNAAKDAVLKWVYRAAMQDGKAIPFVTQAIVPFRLAE